MSAVYEESLKRGYHFNINKFNIDFHPQTLTVTQGQIEYEMQHLLKKLKNRDFLKYNELLNQKNIEPPTLFKIIEGQIEEWEIV